MTTTTEFTKADLPELPEKITVHTVMPDDGWYGNVKAYDHFQMRTYALAAVAASRKKLMQQKPVGTLECHISGEATFWPEDNEVFELSLGDHLVYATPMPQANESEAVRALRELVQAHDETNFSRFKTVGEHADYLNSLWDAARAVLAGELGEKNEQSTGKQDLQVEQPEQAQAMDEREAFHAWFSTYADPHSGRVERNIKRKAAWDAWQARAALAQAQAVGPTPKQEAALQALADEAQALGLYDIQAQASGKAAPSDDDLIAIGKSVGLGESMSVHFGRALLERYGNEHPVDRNAIIEECARVVDNVDSYANPMTARDCADAIRALKDAPQDGAMAAGDKND